MAQDPSTHVGTAVEVKGSATVTHEDGSKEALTQGMVVYKGDTIETDAEGAVNITFKDETVFAVSKNASMTIDEFVYDPDKDGQGDADISVARGVIAYTSGFVGHEDPSDVKIQTPVGSIGIRGTTFSAVVPEQGSSEQFKLTIIEGAIVMHPNNGGEYLLDESRESLSIDTGTMAVTELGILPVQQVLETFNVVRAVTEPLFAPVVNAAGESATPSDTPPLQPIDSPADITPPAEQKTQSAPTDGGTDANGSDAQAAPVVPNEPIELNLMNEDILKPDAVQQQSLQDAGLQTTNAAVITGAAASATAMPALFTATSPVTAHAAAPITAISDPSVYNPSTATAPSGSTTGTTSGGGITSNLPPIATPGVYTALEQAGLSGQSHSFDVGRFFYDPDGTISTLTVGALPPSLSSANITAGILNFTVSALASDIVANFPITAIDNDGLQVTKLFSINLFAETTLPTPFMATGPASGNNVFTLSTGTYSFSTGQGDDSVTFSGAGLNNRIFLGDGNDMAVLNNGARGNAIYGEEGEDWLKIIGVTSGAANLLSGGAGNDILEVQGTTVAYQLFGGTGDDIFRIDAASVPGLSSGGLIDGGTGFDTLQFTTGGNYNLDFAGTGQILDIEKFDMKGNGSMGDQLMININDIFDFAKNNTIFVSMDVGDKIQIHGTGVGASTAVTATGNTVTAPDGMTYNEYSITSGGETATIYTDVLAAGSVVAMP